MKNRYALVVSNIGYLHYTSLKSALKDFNNYKRDSQTDSGRASNENVTLFKNNVIIKEYFAPDNN